MNLHSPRNVFPRQLRFWTVHGTLHALPSFCVAAGFLHLGKSPVAMAAMAIGIAGFVLLFATVTSLWPALSDDRHPLARALRFGAKIRSGIAAVSLLLVMTAPILTPDFWCGFLAAGAGQAFLHAIGNNAEIFSGNRGPMEFLPVMLVTLLEGVVLAFFLLLISFVVLVVQQFRARRNAFAGGYPAA